MATYPTSNLQPGATGAEVQQLQDYLVSMGYLTQAQVNTGYGTYGPQTTAAVKKLQEDLGVDNSTGVGYWGPRTISKVQSSQVGGGLGSTAYSQPQSNLNEAYVSGRANEYNGGLVNQPQQPVQQITQEIQQPVEQPIEQPVEQNESQTGDPALDSTLTALQNYLDELQNRGMAINPYVDISPEQLTSFMNQAQTEIDPYYSGQLKLAKEGFMRDIGYTTNEILENEKQAEQKYGRNVRALGEGMAEKGFARSGQRVLGEQQLAQDTQSSIDANRRKLAYDAGTGAREFAQVWGTSSLTPQMIGASPLVRPGEQTFGTSGGESPLYDLSSDTYNNLKGQKQWEQEANLKTRSSELEGAFKEKTLLQRQADLETDQEKRIRALNI